MSAPTDQEILYIKDKFRRREVCVFTSVFGEYTAAFACCVLGISTPRILVAVDGCGCIFLNPLEGFQSFDLVGAGIPLPLAEWSASILTELAQSGMGGSQEDAKGIRIKGHKPTNKNIEQ